VSACAVCQKVRLGQGSMAAALRTTATMEPFESIALDTVGPLPVDDQGFKYIVVAIDCFSRFVELFPARSASAVEAASAILGVVGRYGAPKQIRSDQGTQYTAHVIEELLRLIGTQHQLTVPYRPEANGIVERANGEVVRHLRALVCDGRVRGCWSTVMPLIQRILNASVHSALGTTPARVLFGDRISLNRGVLVSFEGGGGEQASTTVEDYIQHLTAAQKAIIEASQACQDKVIQARLEATPKTPTSFEVGDYVLISPPERPLDKLSPKWLGPMVVVSVAGNIYQCQDLRTLKVNAYHITRLKYFELSENVDPLQVAALDRDEYIVEAIVEHRGPRKGKPRNLLEFKVRWQGYGPEEDLWLPYKEVKDLEVLDEYAREHPQLGH
jgi:hypothetical protein